MVNVSLDWLVQLRRHRRGMRKKDFTSPPTPLLKERGANMLKAFRVLLNRFFIEPSDFNKLYIRISSEIGTFSLRKGLGEANTQNYKKPFHPP